MCIYWYGEITIDPPMSKEVSDKFNKEQDEIRKKYIETFTFQITNNNIGYIVDGRWCGPEDVDTNLRELCNNFCEYKINGLLEWDADDGDTYIGKIQIVDSVVTTYDKLKFFSQDGKEFKEPENPKITKKTKPTSISVPIGNVNDLINTIGNQDDSDLEEYDYE